MNEPQSSENSQKIGKEEKSGDMYSYRSENNPNNNNNKNNPFQQSEAIRRSIGENNNVNVNVNINQNPSQMINPNFTNKFTTNRISQKASGYRSGNLNLNNYYTSNRISQTLLNIQPDTFCYNWATLLIYLITELIAIIIIATLFNWDQRNHPNNSCIYNLVNWTDYNEDKSLNDMNVSEILYTETNNEINTYYGLFRDINIMLFVGYGMIHTLIKSNVKTSIAFNILSIAISFQIGLIFNLFWENAMNEQWKRGLLNFPTFISSLFNSCAVLISLGGVLGKISHTQYLILFIFEPILSSLNYKICETKLKIIDSGGSLYVHTFGAIFGLAIYWVLFSSDKYKERLRRYDIPSLTDNISKITCFIGVLIILNYFPSFNAGLALSDDGRYRSVINTYFSICGSIVGSFIFSAAFHKGKFVYNHILFSSFSGGVIISGCCAVCLDHWAAFLIGIISGFICIICFEFIYSRMPEIFFYEVYNILIIHGIPGFLGSFLTPMFIADLGRRLNDNYHYVLLNDMTRNNHAQAGIQIGGIFLTCLIAFVGGIAVGFLMRISHCGKVENYFDDREYYGGERNINNVLDDNITNADDNRPSYNN